MITIAIEVTIATIDSILEYVLSNEVTIYGNIDAVKAFDNLVLEYKDIFIDIEGIIDISED